MAAAGLGLVAQILASCMLGAEAFGRYSLLLVCLAIIFGLLSLSVLGENADAFTVMGFTLMGLVATVITQAALVHHVAKLLKGTSPRYEICEWGRTMLPMAGADVTDLLLLNADILTLAIFVDPEYVAFYFAATRLAQFLGYVPYGAKAATAQKYAMLAAKSEHNELQSHNCQDRECFDPSDRVRCGDSE